MVTTTADLNLHPDLNGNVKIFCSQYDNALREIVFTIYDGVDFADLTGLTAKVEGTKPDKYGYSYDATINTTNSTVTVNLVTQMTCVAGLSHAEIVLYSGDSRVGTANFLLMVEEAGISDDTIVSDSVIPGIHDIDTLVEYAQTYADNAEASALEAEGYAAGTQNGTEVESGSAYYQNNAKYYCEHAFSTTPEGYEALVNQVSNTKSVIGSSYNASTNYAVGDRFAYNGVRYKVNVACIGITPPNANYYEVISVDEDTKELESEISSLNSNLTNLNSKTITNGESITTSVSATTWTDVASITLEAGTYIINAGITLGNSQGSAVTIRFSNSTDTRQSLYVPDTNSYSANLVQIVALTNNTTIYLSAWCASAVVIHGPFINAVRLDTDL